MTILWPIDPVSGHPLSIESTAAAVWLKPSRDPSDLDIETSLGINVVDPSYPVGAVRRYGAMPDPRMAPSDENNIQL